MTMNDNQIVKKLGEIEGNYLDGLIAVADQRDNAIAENKRLRDALKRIAALGDTGSEEFKRQFDPDAIGKITPGWRVADAMWEVAIDSLG